MKGARESVGCSVAMAPATCQPSWRAWDSRAQLALPAMCLWAPRTTEGRPGAQPAAPSIPAPTVTKAKGLQWSPLPQLQYPCHTMPWLSHSWGWRGVPSASSRWEAVAWSVMILRPNSG